MPAPSPRPDRLHPAGNSPVSFPRSRAAAVASRACPSRSCGWSRFVFAAIGCLALAVAGCAGGGPRAHPAFYADDPGGDKTTAGAVMGGALGAVTGAVIGGNNGDSGAGALIGAATGAMAGGLMGNSADNREHRDAALRQAHFERTALSNYDLVRMAQSGLSDEVIVNAVRARGGRFDLSPDGMIALKASGVSDGVIAGVQHAAAGYDPIRTIAVVEPIMVGPPPPRMDIYVGPRPYPRRFRRHPCDW